MIYVVLAIVTGFAALALAYYFSTTVLKASQGNERMVELSSAIREGAMAFLRREFNWVSIFVVGMAILIAVLLEDGLSGRPRM